MALLTASFRSKRIYVIRQRRNILAIGCPQKENILHNIFEENI